MCDCLTEDLELLHNLFNVVDSQFKASRFVPPLVLAALRVSSMSILRKYRYTVRDANEMLGQKECGGCGSHVRRSSAMRSAMTSVKVHGTEGAVQYSGDFMRFLWELDRQHEKLIKPLARTAVAGRTMIYDKDFTYRSPVCNENVVGPIATIDAWLEVYDNLWLPYYYIRPILHMALSSRNPSGCTLYQYNQGMFFGDTTRTTQMACFCFDTNPVPFLVDECDKVVFRQDNYTVLSADLIYEPNTKELKCPDYSMEYRDISFQIVCKKVADTKNTSVSLAASINVYRNSFGLLVTKIGWIDSTPIHNDALRVKHFLWPEWLELFPYDKWSFYQTWHIVMNNNCRIKVRVTSLRCKWFTVGSMNPRWTFVNTDQHPEFDESAYVLYEYYNFQMRSGAGVIYPLDSTTVNKFVAANIVTSARCLMNARIERPSDLGTPFTKYADQPTSQLIQAMVFKSLVDNRVERLQHPRLEHVSSEPTNSAKRRL